jgi:undecaprenyl pyrophosphate phosphatase UppP
MTPIILLGIVQGLTEFIPISSTADLALGSRVMSLTLTSTTDLIGAVIS